MLKGVDNMTQEKETLLILDTKNDIREMIELLVQMNEVEKSTVKGIMIGIQLAKLEKSIQQQKV